LQIKRPVAIFLATKAFTWLTFILITFMLYIFRARAIPFGSMLADSLECWDSAHYRAIIEHGYDLSWRMVFFPLYPLAVKAMTFLIKDTLWAGVAVSNSCLLAATVYFYNLADKNYGKKIASMSVMLFMCAPTALFYITSYTESMFFMLTIMGFYYINEKNWFAAVFFGMLSAATRNAGILIMIPFVVGYYGAYKDFKKEFYKLPLYLLAIFSGLAAYMFYSKHIHNDYIAFLHGQSQWYKGGRISFIPFLAYLKSLKNFTVELQLKVTDTRVNMSFIYMTVTLLLLYFGRKLLKLNEAAYAFFIVLFFSIINSSESIARYLSAVYPLWVLFALWIAKQKKEKLVFGIVLAYMMTWQAYMNFRWVMNFWVN